MTVAKGAAVLALAALLLQSAAVAALTCGRQAGWQALDVYFCEPAPKWDLRYLWTPMLMNITCDNDAYDVYTAGSEDQLEESVREGQALLWCGLAHLRDPRRCTLGVSPYHPTFVGIKQPHGVLGASGPPCVVVTRHALDLVRVVSALGGAALFLNAASLATSTSFRLGTGTVMFMAGAVIMLLFILMRSVPHKNKIVAALAVGGTTAVAFFRWLYGTWAPAVSDNVWWFVRSPLFAAYLAVSGLLGLALTYWFDQPGNVKLTTTIRAALQLGGLVAVWWSTTQLEASLALVAALVASRVLGALARHIPWSRIGQALVPRRRRRVAFAPDSASPPQRRSKQLAAAPQRVREPILSSDDEQPRGNASRRRAAGPRSAFTDMMAARDRQQREQLEQQQQDQQRQRQQAVRQQQGRWRGSGSGGAGSSDEEEDGWEGEAGGRYVPVRVQRGPPAPPAPPANASAWAAGPSTSQTPFSQARVVKDFSPGSGQQQREPWLGATPMLEVRPAPGGRATATPPASLSDLQGAAGAAPGRDEDMRAASRSPLVEAGKVFNTQTNKVIKIGGATYNNLVAQGWVVDWQQGAIMHPDTAAEVAAGGSQGAGAAGGEVAAGGGASSARARSAAGAAPSSGRRGRRPASAAR